MPLKSWLAGLWAPGHEIRSQTLKPAQVGRGLGDRWHRGLESPADKGASVMTQLMRLWGCKSLPADRTRHRGPRQCGNQRGQGGVGVENGQIPSQVICSQTGCFSTPG